MRYRYYTNKTLCSVLEDMRGCFKTRNFSYLEGLIEEAQAIGNRMESGLEDKADLEEMRDEKSNLKEELRKLQKQVNKLKKQTSEERSNEE